MLGTRRASPGATVDPQKLGCPYVMSWEIIPMTGRPVDLAVGQPGGERGMDKLHITPNGQLLDQVVTIQLNAHPTSSRAAREFVASTLEDWGWTEHVATAVLLTSELVTNAVIHAESDIAVTVRGEQSLRVEVSDESPEQVSPVRLGDGRGLRLVDALAASWGVSPQRRGKVVWFELAR